MSIKLIAVDMDGTFLSDAKTYNRPRFLAQYQRMREQNIRFVVASGNQYYQLISFFPEIAHQIAFVAENGGWVVSGNEDVFNCQLPVHHFNAVVDHLQTLPNIEIIACGKRSAYTLNRYNDALVNADKLRGTRLYVSSGTGLAGRPDQVSYLVGLGAPQATAQAASAILQVEGGVIEAAVNKCTHDLKAKLDGLGIPAHFELRNMGTHSWPYWTEDMDRAWNTTIKPALGV